MLSFLAGSVSDPFEDKLNGAQRLTAHCTWLMNELTQTIQLSGVSLHAGVETQVRLFPAAAGEGRYFVRVDLPDAPQIPARIDAVVSTTLSTELGQGEARVRTVEHLLATLAALGVSDARIEINGPELPLLDGSAVQWVEAIAAWDKTQPAPVAPLAQPITVHAGDAFVAAFPASRTRFTYGIDFELPAIGNQWHSWELDSQSFATEIAPARTFALAHQIEYLRAQGLIKGGSLENALVCGSEGWINPPLRFANEPARHKLLDLVGDLSLLGTIPVAHYLAYKASHHLHVQLAQKIRESQTPD
nr:UDP-3-O-acyl-N-acetylglucosamine deacetylase [Desertifilum tharense]